MEKKLTNEMTTREFLDRMDQICKSPSNRLIGDMLNGYVYKECDPTELYLMNDAVQSRRKLHKEVAKNQNHFKIKKVIYNGPATVVIWADDTKTIVQCQEGDIFDPEKGLAMAISKRALGDKGNYYYVFRKHAHKQPSLLSKFVEEFFNKKKQTKKRADK